MSKIETIETVIRASNNEDDIVDVLGWGSDDNNNLAFKMRSGKSIHIDDYIAKKIAEALVKHVDLCHQL